MAVGKRCCGERCLSRSLDDQILRKCSARYRFESNIIVFDTIASIFDVVYTLHTKYVYLLHKLCPIHHTFKWLLLHFNQINGFPFSLNQNGKIVALMKEIALISLEDSK